MSTIIKDGTGGGQTLKIDSQNRAHVHGVMETLSQNASREGEGYNINTGSITLTSSTISELLYIENLGDNDLHVSTIGFLIGNSTGGTGDLEVGVNKNITGGTLIGSNQPKINENKNCGSKKTLDVQLYSGVEGRTQTGGTEFYSSLLAGDARTYVINTGDIIIPRGTNISLNVTPPSGNTSMTVQIFLSIIEYTIN